MEKFYKGIPGSGRIAFGTAIVFLQSNIFIPRYPIRKDDKTVDQEIKKLESALATTKKEIEKLKTDLKKDTSPLETGYIDTTILMLEDPLIREQVTQRIAESHFNVEWVFNEVIEEIAAKISKSDDYYFQERAPDVLSVGKKVLKNLLGSEEHEIPKNIDDPIIVSHTLSPPEIVSLYKKNVRAFVTEIGGKTSHVTIMSRDLKIPAVIGIDNITNNVHTGDKVIVDGTIGTIVVNPQEETIALYKFREEKYEKYENTLKAIEKQPCVLKSGEEITLLANMDVEEELVLIDKSNCQGIGLFRTEYIFLNRNRSPSEEEQRDFYTKVVKKFDPYEVTIRIIDIGGDKKPPYMDYYEEQNPFLGWRGIRYALSHKDILRAQIKAILGASHFGNARIMFPMVSDIDEINQIFEVVESCKEELGKKNVPFKENIQLGIMVETPSSIILLDKIADLVDFISVGTNDLIQYTLAIDRGNGMVATEFDPIHPAILRSLRLIADIASQKDLEVSICGEMAGDPLYTLLLLGFGYRKLSMSLMSIPTIKNIIINSSADDAAEIAETALEFSSKKDVGRYVREQMTKKFSYLEDYFRQYV
ncbi:MAG: phosphoenolpyruvate--protein phosphotransferase [Spirochaetota bacterium]|nr:MAG: phosphoenolpyruvate--protein phosphotransferase [Spirochaetota bacterium]